MRKAFHAAPCSGRLETISRCRKAHASFGSIPSGRSGSRSRRQLARIESIETHQPISLIKPMFAHERRRDERQFVDDIGNRTERRIINTPQLVLLIQRRCRCKIVASFAGVAPTIICVLCPAAANAGAFRTFAALLPSIVRSAI